MMETVLKRKNLNHNFSPLKTRDPNFLVLHIRKPIPTKFKQLTEHYLLNLHLIFTQMFVPTYTIKLGQIVHQP